MGSEDGGTDSLEKGVRKEERRTAQRKGKWQAAIPAPNIFALTHARAHTHTHTNTLFPAEPCGSRLSNEGGSLWSQPPVPQRRVSRCACVLYMCDLFTIIILNYGTYFYILLFKVIIR